MFLVFVFYHLATFITTTVNVSTLFEPCVSSLVFTDIRSMSVCNLLNKQIDWLITEKLIDLLQHENEERAMQNTDYMQIAETDQFI